MQVSIDNWVELGCERIANQLGLHYIKARKKDFQKNILDFCKDNPEKSSEAWLKEIIGFHWSEKLSYELVKRFTIGETYFYRHAADLNEFYQNILSETFLFNSERQQKTRIWSAACSSGEEPYSLAMMCKDFMPLDDSSKLEIYATDINTDSLEKAKKALYKEWSFREEVAPTLKKRFFTEIAKGVYRLHKDIRENVCFQPLNLVNNHWKAPFSELESFDVIFCRNILIYFNQESIDEVIQRFISRLKPGGWLVTSSCEVPLVQHPKLEACRYGASTFYKKHTQAIVRAKIQRPRVKAVKRKVAVTTPVKRVCAPKVASDLLSKLLNASRGIVSDVDRMLNDAELLFKNEHYQSVLSLLLENEASFKAKISLLQKGRYHRLLGIAFAHSAQHEEAIRHLDEAILQSKTDIELYYILGFTHWENGDVGKAIQSFKKVLFLDPFYVPAEMNLAHIEQNLGHQENSERHLRNALKALNKLDDESIPEWSDGLTVEELKESCRTQGQKS